MISPLSLSLSLSLSPPPHIRVLIALVVCGGIGACVTCVIVACCICGCARSLRRRKYTNVQQPPATNTTIVTSTLAAPDQGMKGTYTREGKRGGGRNGGKREGER